MIFTRLIPLAGLLLFAVWLDAKSRKGDDELHQSDDGSPTPEPAPSKDEPITVVKDVVEPVEPAVPPPLPKVVIEAPAMSKALLNAMAKLSEDQQKAFLGLLNAGTSTDLQDIPGVGASMAKHIRAARPFASPVELIEISGIGERRLIEFIAWVKGQRVD